MIIDLSKGARASSPSLPSAQGTTGNEQRTALDKPAGRQSNRHRWVPKTNVRNELLCFMIFIHVVLSPIQHSLMWKMVFENSKNIWQVQSNLTNAVALSKSAASNHSVKTCQNINYHSYTVNYNHTSDVNRTVSSSRTRCYKALDRVREVIYNNPEANAIRTLKLTLHDTAQVVVEYNDTMKILDKNNHTLTKSHYTVPGVSNNYLRKLIRGKSVALVGDSTLRNLAKWWILLYEERSTSLPWMKVDESIASSETTIAIDRNLSRASKDILRIAFKKCPPCTDLICKCNPMHIDGKRVSYFDEEEAPGYCRSPVVMDDDDAVGGIITQIEFVTSLTHPMKAAMETFPDILVFNIGLHLFHLHGSNTTTTDWESMSKFSYWLNYEELVLQPMLNHMRRLVASKVESSGDESGRDSQETRGDGSEDNSDTKLTLLFKTTNRVCDNKYVGAYETMVTKYNHGDPDTIQACFDHFSKMWEGLERTKQLPMGLRNRQHTKGDDIWTYCRNGILAEKGSDHLNRRLIKFVYDYNNFQGIDSTRNHLVVQIFNDHDVLHCNYTTRGDGRHYHELNLARLRLLLNQLDCVV